MEIKQSTATITATIKLNGSNYLQWARAFRLFVGEQRKLHHLDGAPPADTNEKFSSWQANDYQVISWMVNSMENHVSANVLFLHSANEMWITVQQIYSDENNVSRVFSLYEELFALKQGDHSIHDYFAELSGKLNEL